MLNRRGFLSSSLALGAGLTLPQDIWAQLGSLPSKLPDRSLYDSSEDSYWRELRKQFLLPSDEVYLNNGTVGSSPAPVLRAVFDGYEACEKLNEADPEDYPIWGYASWNQFRDPLAAFAGCDRDEMALLRNATEANSYIANGVDLKPGDEVLMTDQEHPGGEMPWQLRAKRYGIVVKKVALPKPVENPAQVLNLFSDAITPRTRVLFFSHISTFSRTSGCRRRRAPDFSMSGTKSSIECGTQSPPKVGTTRRFGRNASSGLAVRTCRRSGDCVLRSSWLTTLGWIGLKSVIASFAITFWLRW